MLCVPSFENLSDKEHCQAKNIQHKTLQQVNKNSHSRLVENERVWLWAVAWGTSGRSSFRRLCKAAAAPAWYWCVMPGKAEGRAVRRRVLGCSALLPGPQHGQLCCLPAPLTALPCC